MNLADHTVLLVEDNRSDVALVERAFRKAKVLNPLAVVENGDEAVRYLDGAEPYADRARFPLPALVLLDLKLPRLSGFEVLAWIRRDARFRRLPTVVLTSSTELEDVDRAYELGANSYLVKPVALAPFVDMIAKLHAYWVMAEKPTLGRATGGGGA